MLLVIHFALYHGSPISPLPSLFLPFTPSTATPMDFSGECKYEYEFVGVCVVHRDHIDEVVCAGASVGLLCVMWEDLKYIHIIT